MGLFDGVVTELAQKFGLGDRAGPLVSSLLAFLTDPQRGGLGGVLNRFRQAGLDDQVASWVGRGSNETLAPDQLERGLGQDNVDRIATSAGVSPGIASGALAFLVPKVVDLLTPDGTIPTGVPAGLGASLGGAAAGAAGAVGAGARRTVGATGEAAASGGSALRKLVPLLLLLLLGFLGYRLFSGGDDRSRPVATTADTVTAPGTATDEPMTTGTAPEAADADDPDADAANPEAAVDAAMRKASTALASLQPGYSAEELASALNLNIINFASGSAEVPAESRDVLTQSAKAIAGAPEGTVLEVGGYTDNTGNAAGNQRLSARRADAVRQYLIQQGAPAASLKAKGYGPSSPVADNETEMGRFQNRRIEFKVLE